MPAGRLLPSWRCPCAELVEHGLAMMALADYLTHESDVAATIDRLIRILDRDSVREAIAELRVDARVHLPH